MHYPLTQLPKLWATMSLSKASSSIPNQLTPTYLVLATNWSLISQRFVKIGTCLWWPTLWWELNNTKAHQQFANCHSQLQTFLLCPVIWHHPQTMMICSSMLNWIQISPDCFVLVNSPGPTRLPSKTTERSHYNPPSNCMHENTHFGYQPTRLTPPLKGTGLSFRKFPMPPTLVLSWSITSGHVTSFSPSIHSFGLRPMGQSSCVLGSLLVCDNTLEQPSLGNLCVPVAPPPWQRPVLYLNLSRVQVNGVLPLLSGISKRIPWCSMHSSFHDPRTMTPRQLRHLKMSHLLFESYLNRTIPIPSALSFHTSCSSSLHMLIYVFSWTLSKKKNPRPPFPLL